MVGGQEHQIVFIQSVEPLQTLRHFHLSQFEYRTILGVVVVKRTDFREFHEIISQRLFSFHPG